MIPGDQTRRPRTIAAMESYTLHCTTIHPAVLKSTLLAGFPEQVKIPDRHSGHFGTLVRYSCPVAPFKGRNPVGAGRDCSGTTGWNWSHRNDTAAFFCDTRLGCSGVSLARAAARDVGRRTVKRRPRELPPPVHRATTVLFQIRGDWGRSERLWAGSADDVEQALNRAPEPLGCFKCTVGDL